MEWTWPLWLQSTWGRMMPVEANEYYSMEEYSEAIKVYEEILKNGEHANVYYNLGNSYFRVGDIGNSIWAYEKALKLKPGNPVALAGLSDVALFFERDFNKAKDLSYSAYSSGINNSEIITSYAMYLEALGDFEGIAKVIFKAIENDPKSPNHLVGDGCRGPDRRGDSRRWAAAGGGAARAGESFWNGCSSLSLREDCVPGPLFCFLFVWPNVLPLPLGIGSSSGSRSYLRAQTLRTVPFQTSQIQKRNGYRFASRGRRVG